MSEREKKREREREIFQKQLLFRKGEFLGRSANQLEENRDLFYDTARVSNPIEIG